MITVTQIRTNRLAAGITGQVLCLKLGIARSCLSDIERGYLTPTSEELGRIDAALTDLIRSKRAIQEAAKTIGWPVAV